MSEVTSDWLQEQFLARLRVCYGTMFGRPMPPGAAQATDIASRRPFRWWEWPATRPGAAGLLMRLDCQPGLAHGDVQLVHLGDATARLRELGLYGRIAWPPAYCADLHFGFHVLRDGWDVAVEFAATILGWDATGAVRTRAAARAVPASGWAYPRRRRLSFD